MKKHLAGAAAAASLLSLGLAGLSPTNAHASLISDPTNHTQPVEHAAPGTVIIGRGTIPHGGYVIIDLAASMPGPAPTATNNPTSTSTTQDFHDTPEGGGWDYGSYINWNGNKVCYSVYYHQWRSHSSSVQLADLSARSEAGPAQKSDARVAGSYSATCYAYYWVD